MSGIKMLVLGGASLMLAACSQGNGGSGPVASTIDAPAMAGGAEAILRTANGTTVGRVTARDAGGAVRIALEASGMTPGVHGAHVHTVGRCDPPSFESAGAHWNPTSRQHGTENPAGPHGGDAPNLTIGADGRGTLAHTLPSGTLGGLLDADGSAFVVHANADDLRSDPTGNSGGRIACGVFVRS